MIQSDFDADAKRLGRIIMYPTKDGKHSQYKKTEPSMRLPPASNLLISGPEFIEKQIF